MTRTEQLKARLEVLETRMAELAKRVRALAAKVAKSVKSTWQSPLRSEAIGLVQL